MGVTARLPERPYTELSDDARVRHYSQMSPDTWRDLELKLAIARRYHDEVKLAAMRGERTLGAQMVSQGHGGPRQTGHPLDEFDAMDSRIHASVVRDDAEMEQQIQVARQGIARARRDYEESLRHPQSVSERVARTVGDVAGYTGRVVGAGAGLIAGAVAAPVAPGAALLGAAVGGGTGGAVGQAMGEGAARGVADLLGVDTRTRDEN